MTVSSADFPSGRHRRIDNLLFRSGLGFQWDLSHGTNRLPTTRPIADALGTLDPACDRITRYYEPTGEEALRQAVAQYEHRWAGSSLASDDVVMSAGAREALTLLYFALHRRCGVTHALIVGPQFALVRASITAAGLSCSELLDLGSADLEPSVDMLTDAVEALGPEWVVHLTNPANPSGMLRDADQVGALMAAAAKSHCYIVVDKVCSDLPSGVLNPPPPYLSTADVYGIPDRVAVVDSFSKRRSIPGLRIGYLISRSSGLQRDIGDWLYGGSQASIINGGLVADLEAGASGGVGQVDGVWDVVDRNHAVMERNWRLASEMLEGHSRLPIASFTNQNTLAHLALPQSATDEDVVKSLLLAGIASYPLTSFVAMSPPPASTHHTLRLTLSVETEVFYETLLRTAEVLSTMKGPVGR